MINAFSKTKTNECQNCIRSALHHPVSSTTFTQLCILLSAYTLRHTHPPQILIEMSEHTLAQALQACWSYGNVPFQCGALPAAHTALPQCDLAVCWEKETFNLLPFTADVPSLNLILCWVWTINSQHAPQLTKKIQRLSELDISRFFFPVGPFFPHICALQWIHSCCGVLSERTSIYKTDI